MINKTSLTYKNEILKKYQIEKGGEMISYLLHPTRKQIKEACIWLLNRRNEKYDESILDRFFKFKEGENKMRAIEKVHGDKFKPIINFLMGETKSTTPANLELISWLIDFQPRPLSVYLKFGPTNKSEIQTNKSEIQNSESYEKNDYSLNLVQKTEKKSDSEIKVIKKKNKKITIISQVNPYFKITTLTL